MVASQYIGSKDRENGSKAASQLILITSLLGAVSALLVLVFGRQIFGALFGNVDAGVLDAGLLYLRLSAWSYLFLAVYNACAGLYRSMGKTRELMFVSLMMNAINVAGNAIGIFALHAGVRGVAIPSLISRAFAAVVMLKLVFGKGNQIHVTLSPLILLVYSLTEETRGLIILLIVLHNVFNALLAPCAFPLSSGLRAAGDVKFTMFAAIFSTVICRVTFSVLFGIILDMGVVGVTVAMVIDWCVKAALIFRRYRSRKWTAFRVI